MNKKNILVVDDDQGILEALALILTSEGYKVQTSASGSAVRKLDGKLPDLIIMDVLLSGEDGRDLTKLIKKQPNTKDIPVIMISAHPNIKKSCIDCGAVDFLSKPFDIDELLKKIELRTN